MWWEKSVFYEIYVPSFHDSDDDGFGDIIGIQKKLPYLKELGVDCIWLTPFYPSPKVDNGYDVSDYCGVDDQFGKLDDIIDLINVAHDWGIRIILDVVFNHTSTQHPWFLESRSNINSPKREWYIWRDKPNNWESFFGGSAWELDSNTNQYYYHSFAIEQADLNWGNPDVIEAIYSVLDFWIELGIDGFRFDVINNLTVNYDFKDNPLDESRNQIHEFDVNQVGIEKILYDLRNYIKNIDANLVMIAEISSDELSILNHYQEFFDMVFNFNIGSLDSLNLKKLIEVYKQTINLVYINQPTLFFNSHDMNRSWNRLAKSNIQTYKLLATFMLINKGIPFLFQGEELGIADYLPVSIQEVRDIQAINKYNEMLLKDSEFNSIKEANKVNRDRSRAMIPWDNQSIKRGWIGIGDKNPHAEEIFKWYQDLISFRKEAGPFLKAYEFSVRDDLVSYRIDDYLVLLNFSDNVKIINEYQKSYDRILSSGNFYEADKLPAISCWIGKK